MSRKVLAFVATAVLACMAAQVHAWEKPPIKIDAAFNFKFNVKVGPSNQYKAPWYSYFPYDPSLHPSTSGNPYPNWPSTPAEGASNDKSAQAGRFPHWPGHMSQPTGAAPEPEQRPGQVAATASLTAPVQTGSVAAPPWQTSNYALAPPTSSYAWQPMAAGTVPSYWYGR